MFQQKQKFIAGLISPEVLAKTAIIERCEVLEIRYDLFKDVAEWNGLSQKVSELNPKALRLGTIRLEMDGGKWENDRAGERNELFERILNNGKTLDWIDMERGVDFSQLKRRAKIICSWHLFDRVPSEQELCEFAEECLKSGACGCKVAAMAHSENDARPLYGFAKKYGEKFELLSAFAMGEHGQESRTRSLKEGANLTYASIGKALAPGQLSVEDTFLYLSRKWI
ncbi:MAG: type I 3-dehydroquinate dehydratase [Candidatus Fibromonas sp.]|nr:type I 3-dehydroquinate dehydratase [Candidatus Fibromonas sp.]